MRPLHIFSCTVWFVLLKMFLIIYGNIKKRSLRLLQGLLLHQGIPLGTSHSLWVPPYPCIQINCLLSIHSEKGNSKKIDKGVLTFIISAITFTKHQIMVWMRTSRSISPAQIENLARKDSKGWSSAWCEDRDDGAYFDFLGPCWTRSTPTGCSDIMEVFPQKEKSRGFLTCCDAYTAALIIIS